MHLLPRRTRTSADERGTALVEFAFVGVIFFMLLFGIIAMSVLLAVKQNMTQAASEAVRSAIAVVDDTTTTPSTDERREVALAALSTVVTEFEVDCADVGTKCQVKIHECNDPAGTDFALLADNRTLDPESATVNPAGAEPSDPCMTAFIEFENSGDNRVLPPFPIISGLEPDTLTSQSTVHLVPVPA